ncbi:hypothetical protein L1987_13429 [Smallanthus sonchifolius]|uniref:Uncharacterized protein n=1 Tax=Smallanthus sonchifolius TaxID=185202 RepID=A0ACB9JIU6_9ASTR|nr:hypothetical protein L1987_13429 [Smallanthus sonchifolius]
MSSANPDDEDVQEEPDQVSESEHEEESKEELVGGTEGANSDTNSGESVPYSVMHGEDTSSEEVRPHTTSPPRSPNTIPLRNEWVNFMGLARHRNARKTALPPKKRARSSTDAKPLPKRHCLLNQLEIGESSHRIRPKDVRPIEQTRPPIPRMSKPQPVPKAQLSEDASEDSDDIIEALNDRLVQL